MALPVAAAAEVQRVDGVLGYLRLDAVTADAVECVEEIGMDYLFGQQCTVVAVAQLVAAQIEHHGFHLVELQMVGAKFGKSSLAAVVLPVAILLNGKQNGNQLLV